MRVDWGTGFLGRLLDAEPRCAISPTRFPVVATSDDDCDWTSHLVDELAEQHRQKWHARTGAKGPLGGGALLPYSR
jgi:hypothetical protein